MRKEDLKEKAKEFYKEQNPYELDSPLITQKIDFAVKFAQFITEQEQPTQSLGREIHSKIPQHIKDEVMKYGDELVAKQSVEHIIRHSIINYLKFMGDFEEWDRNNVINVYQKSNHYYNFLKALKEYTQTQSVSGEDLLLEFYDELSELPMGLTNYNREEIVKEFLDNLTN